MTSSRQQAIDEQLTQLHDLNAVTHAEVERVLPVTRPHGDEAG
jgi:hypothetical protein